jgi:hypothetical protein
VQVLQVLDGQPEPLHDRGRDQLGLTPQRRTARGEGDSEAALVARVAFPAQVAGRLEPLEQW